MNEHTYIIRGRIDGPSPVKLLDVLRILYGPPKYDLIGQAGCYRYAVIETVAPPDIMEHLFHEFDLFVKQ